MSTRANIKIVGESGQTTFLYRHCDGYPSGLGDELADFISNQCYELDDVDEGEPVDTDDYARKIILELGDDIEFTTDIHGDIAYLYVIDLVEKDYSMYKVTYDYSKGWDNLVQEFVKIEDNE